MLYVAVFLTPLLLMFLFVSVKMLPQYQRGVVIRLGKLRVPKVPGLVVLIPLLKNIIRVDLRTKTLSQAWKDHAESYGKIMLAEVHAFCLCPLAHVECSKRCRPDR